MSWAATSRTSCSRGVSRESMGRPLSLASARKPTQSAGAPARTTSPRAARRISWRNSMGSTSLSRYPSAPRKSPREMVLASAPAPDTRIVASWWRSRRVRISHSESRSPARPSPTRKTIRERRIRLSTLRHSSAEPASARTCISGWSSINIPRPARTTASGSTTTTPRCGRARPRLVDSGDPEVLAISFIYRPFPPRTCANSGPPREEARGCRELGPGWELPAPQPSSESTADDPPREPEEPGDHHTGSDQDRGVRGDARRRRGDPHRHRGQPRAQRHEDREDDAGRGSHADGLPLESGPLPGGVSASQDHRQNGHQEEQEVAGGGRPEVGPDVRAGDEALRGHRHRGREPRVTEEGRRDAAVHTV